MALRTAAAAPLLVVPLLVLLLAPGCWARTGRTLAQTCEGSCRRVNVDLMALYNKDCKRVLPNTTLKRNAFFLYTGNKFTCGKGKDLPQNTVIAEFSAAQGVGKATYYVKAAEAGCCTDLCDASHPCTTNARGMNLIKSWEGCCLKPYLCPAKVCTIGWGHSTYAPTQPTPITKNTKEIDATTADKYLKNDVAYFEKDVLKLVKVPLNANQFAALVSWDFNGAGGSGKPLSNTRMLSKLNNWDYDGAAFELVDGFSGDAVARKRDEQALFKSAYTDRKVSDCVSGRTGGCKTPCT